jgi:chemotaxis protein methyltransferase CheR
MISTDRTRGTPSVTSFDVVRDFIRQEAGIVLDAGKEYLVDARLSPLARLEGFASIDALIGRLSSAGATDLRRKVLDAMTTNETTFFRDGQPFDLMRTTIVPQLLRARAATRRLSIWYAACSTGQEPYSVTMLMREHFPELASWEVEQIATDISTRALARAEDGRYSQLEVNRGLPAALLIKYFEKRGLEWQLHDTIRRAVSFRRMNLNAPWPGLPRFDIIFVRNVMIYFDVDAKKRILNNVFDHLRPDGYLFLGGAETPLHLDDRFVRVPIGLSGCYRPVAATST